MVLVFENVSLSYGNGRSVALHDVSFSMEKSDFIVLTGPSGAGKSSLLRLIYQAEQPNSGTIYLFGENISHTPRSARAQLRQKIGVVFQDFRLLPYLTIFDNAALPLRIMGKDENYIRKTTHELLEWVGLGSRMDALPQELSGGEQQRVAIARAVIHRPRLLLADEPTGNVDRDTAFKLFHLFDALNKLGTAVILATHQREAASALKRPIFDLRNGTLTADAKEIV